MYPPLFIVLNVKTTVVPVNLCNATSLREGVGSSEESDLSEIQQKISEVKNQPSFGPITAEHLEDNDKEALSEGGDQEDGPRTESPEEEIHANDNPQSKEGESTGTDYTTNEPQSEDKVIEHANDPGSEEGLSNATDNQSKEESSTDVSEQTEASGVADLSVSPDHAEINKKMNAKSDADYRNYDEKQKLENTDHADDGGECPKTCPTGDVMVCARCSHRIYRTFMSTCYMRMYQCHNPTEKLVLVSRHACQGSAPYLGEMARPKHNLVEPQDDDPVLNYIFAAQDPGHKK